MEEQAMQKSSVDLAHQTFLHYLSQVRCRLTKPRLEIARWLLEVEEVFQEHEINTWVRERGLPIGPRSVSNTLELLVKCGTILRVTQHGESFYLSLARRTPGTLCLLCTDCFKLQETLLPNASLATQRIAKKEGYHVSCAFHVVRGTCGVCKRAKLQRQQKSA